MHILEIGVFGFRNLKNFYLRPEKGLNLLVGENAQGKTNFLEAVFLLANGSGFRAGQDRDLVGWEHDRYSIYADYVYEGKEYKTALEYTVGKRKRWTINNKNHSLFQDRLVTITFTPDDLFLLKGSPFKRRSFLDNLLINLSSEFRTQHENFQRILARRNSLLRHEPINQTMLEVLDQVFSQTASQIILARLNLLRVLEEHAVKYYRIIGGQEELQLKYALSFPLAPGRVNLEIIQQNMLEALKEARKKESVQRSTLVGPHRDDINFYVNQQNARIFGSQGQQRNIVVAIKLAELDAFKTIKNTYPIMLLDEVLAELDAVRRRMMLDFLQNSAFQTFMTSVDISLFGGINGKIIRLEKGRLLE